MYENEPICKKCGGVCCNRSPGIAHPDDFGLPDETQLIAALKSGLWAIDWWEGDPRDGKDELSRGFYVRPAEKGNEGRLYDGSWGHKGCTFLTPTGCTLPAEKRPQQCQLLEPRGGDAPCIGHGESEKHDYAIAWLPYWALLDSMDERLRDV